MEETIKLLTTIVPNELRLGIEKMNEAYKHLAEAQKKCPALFDPEIIKALEANANKYLDGIVDGLDS